MANGEEHWSLKLPNFGKTSEPIAQGLNCLRYHNYIYHF